MCEGIRVEITKKVRERDEDGLEGRRKGREGSEWGENYIWQGDQAGDVERMKRRRV